MLLLALAARAPDDLSPSFLSSRFAVRQHANVPGAVLSTMPFQDARSGTAFPANACPTVQEWEHVCRLEAQKCGGFGAFTSCQEMLHMSSDGSRIRAWRVFHAARRCGQRERCASTQNSSVKQFVAADLPIFPTESSGRDMQLSKTVFLSDTRSSESNSGLSRNNDSNMVCEP